VRAARERGLEEGRPTAAVDSTGYEARRVSAYYVKVSGRRSTQRRWPKLTVTIDVRTHLYLAARIVRGPRQDAPGWKPAVREAAANAPLGAVLGDAGYDSEANHAYAREQAHARTTRIPINRRNAGRKWPKTRYRREMKRRFRRPRPDREGRRRRPRRIYNQRWQVESGFSRDKRLMGSALRATNWSNQKGELRLRCVVHDLLLLCGHDEQTERQAPRASPPPKPAPAA
jgi:hypothetical protein